MNPRGVSGEMCTEIKQAKFCSMLDDTSDISEHTQQVIVFVMK
jgi:hypothetical protein